jgi:hypothetical protein
MVPDHDLITSSAFAGAERGNVDGPIVDARFYSPLALLQLPDGCTLVGDGTRLRKISADLQQVSTVAGDGEWGHRDGAAAQARFCDVRCSLLLPDDRVLVVDFGNHRIRLLSADLQQVSTVAGNGERGHRDGAAVQAQFRSPSGLALLPDGRVLVADCWNHRIRLLSADLQHVSTVAGDGDMEHQDGAAMQARFNQPSGLALLADGRVLVADSWNNRIRLLSADLQQVSTVVGDGELGHRDGAAMQAAIDGPSSFAVLLDGRVLVSSYTEDADVYQIGEVRILSADLQEVHTAVQYEPGVIPGDFIQRPDGRVLVGTFAPPIRMLEGFPSFATLAWRRRRTLLLCLLAVHAEPCAEGTPPPAQAAAADARSAGALSDVASSLAQLATEMPDEPQLAESLVLVRAVAEHRQQLRQLADVLFRVAALPEELWKGPCIFQYL